ncbi:MAG: DNA polymerase I [bacterium TMED88]|nr:DNA polymerase I [Deltaproteobacteria bacterium]OUV32622.1 MAG: DNA polymerase I [bacterium TMED88]
MDLVSPKKNNDSIRRLAIIDGANSVYRAFFAIPNLRAPDGTPTNAVYGFATMLGKVLREESPDALVVAFDPRGGSFRRRIYPEYKANRDAQPEDLSAQIPLVRELVDAWSLPLIEVEDFEADDVIASLVGAVGPECEVRIISTDKDLMQLVNDRVQLVDSVKDKRYGPAEVEGRFGVPPEQLLDVRALVGDPSDNIPGVKGIGEKGAAKLITEFGTLEELLARADEVKAKRAREGLQGQRESAELSKELATLRADVPLPIELSDLVLRSPDVERLRALYERLGFTRLMASLDGMAAPKEATGAQQADSREEVEVLQIHDAEQLESVLKSLEGDAPLILHGLVGQGSAVDARLVGLGLAQEAAKAFYVPIVGEGLVAQEGLSESVLSAALSEFGLGAETNHSWAAIDSKAVHSAFAGIGIELPPPVDDFAVASLLLDPAGHAGLEATAMSARGKRLLTWEELAGRGAKATPAESLDVHDAATWVGQHVAALSDLREDMRSRLEEDGLLPLYDEVEVPLAKILSRVECQGVRVDEGRLDDLSEEYRGRLAEIKREIYQQAGEEFLISSPKQLQRILFEKLNLPVIKKTKTGYSTAEDVLEQLQVHHDLPGMVLSYRKLAKLMSTYVEALPKLVSERTGRIHPQFNQLGAATGRMSASHPNVQNIPIRGEEGARIREAFVPAEGKVMLSADYSQVELRILAHYSDDATLIDAFQQGEDVHRRTAAEVAGVGLDEVTPDQRARAKAVNFGIIYGSSAFGLANQLGIAAGEAQETIDAYFARYPGVRQFIDGTIARAKEAGFVSTLLGRRRSLPELGSRNRGLRQAAERMAVNTVIQGTAADLIKKAMVEVEDRLAEAPVEAQMILQVHDELVFEVAPSEVATLSALLSAAMEGAMELKVPLVTDVGMGANWRQAH